MFGDSGNLGARKRGGKKKRSKARSNTACRRGIVRFKTKRGKVVQFKGKTGPGCGPRPKPKTGHLAPYKRSLAQASKACKGLPGKSFRSCVATEMHKPATKRRRRR